MYGLGLGNKRFTVHFYILLLVRINHTNFVHFCKYTKMV
nr:MAG TPA: hypothetical protein [Caudoviricetes sp.]